MCHIYFILTALFICKEKEESLKELSACPESHSCRMLKPRLNPGQSDSGVDVILPLN